MVFMCHAYFKKLTKSKIVLRLNSLFKKSPTQMEIYNETKNLWRNTAPLETMVDKWALEGKRGRISSGRPATRYAAATLDNVFSYQVLELKNNRLAHVRRL